MSLTGAETPNVSWPRKTRAEELRLQLADEIVRGVYAPGAALDETAGYARGPSAAEAVSDEYIARECPRLTASAPFFEPEWWDSTFELGLESLLAGMRAAAESGSGHIARKNRNKATNSSET